MRPKLFTLITACILLCQASIASHLFIPMDALSQKNHLKAYGIVYAAMAQGIKVDWLLNYKGGSFGMENNNGIADLCKQRGVSFVKMTDKQYNAITKQLSTTQDEKVVVLEKAPKIAVYTPLDKKPWDDAVTLALTYAEIPFDKIYANEVLTGALDKYDWLHLHHEDFTGQYGKFLGQFGDAAWYKEEVSTMEGLANANGFNKVSQMQLAVVKKIKDFVDNGGNLFAMCSATETFDIALAADGVDICPKEFDGDDADAQAQNRLDFSKCLAFRNFKVELRPYVYMHSTIDNTSFRQWPSVAANNYLSSVPREKDVITLYPANAKFDEVDAMLTQDHTQSIEGFMGQTTAFRKETLKPNVTILADFPDCNEARYIHGELGKGSWTFMGGHDPEDYQHMVGNAPTDLSLFPNSPGYRLILNNVLFPAVKTTPVPTVTLNTNTATVPVSDSSAQRPGAVGNVADLKDIKIYPNPANDELVITISQGNIERVTIENFAGQQMFTQSCRGDKASVSMSSLTPGIYAIKVNGEYAGKVVKE